MLALGLGSEVLQHQPPHLLCGTFTQGGKCPVLVSFLKILDESFGCELSLWQLGHLSSP